MAAPSQAQPELTRVDAETRARTVAVNRYQVDLDISDAPRVPDIGGTFRSVTTIEFTATPVSSTFVDIIAKQIVSAILNNREIPASDIHPGRIDLVGLADTNVLVVHALCRYSNTGEGLHRFREGSDGPVYLYTVFEPAEARRVFACFDQPDLKALFDLRVTAPADWPVVVSNSATESSSASGATTVHTFGTTPRMSTYLLALIAGPYDSWSGTYTDETGPAPDIPLRIFCRESLADYLEPDIAEVFDLTKRGFAFYHKMFEVPYAFGKYDQIFVPQFNQGAMENAGAVTFREELIFRGRVTATDRAKRAETLLHEMAHMWFGNLVTMRWWDDLWLNEAFATFASVLCLAEGTDYTESWTTFSNVDKAAAVRLDQQPTTHPVADPTITDLTKVGANFDDITYRKGASIIKQLLAYVGRSAFEEGLRDYFRTHKFQNATIDDLIASLETHSGRSLTRWRQMWLTTRGVNTLRAEYHTDDGQTFSRFAVTQSEAEPGDGTTRLHKLRVGIYDDDQGRLTRTSTVDVEIDSARADVATLHGASMGKLILVNADDLTYGLLRFDPRSLDTVRCRIGDIAEPLARAQIWATLWEMVRNAEFKARDFVGLASDNLAAESEMTVAQNLLLQAQTALTLYAEPEWALVHGWPTFADRLLELARSADPGSQRQLAYINTLCADRYRERQHSTVLSKRHTDVLTALLDTDSGDAGLPGLMIDTDQDLRWRVVAALATAGVIDAQGPPSPFIDAEYQKQDPSEAGHLSREHCRTARPQSAVKDEAWQHLTMNTDLENLEARAVCAGFAAPGQEQLLTPYTKRYFDEILTVWNNQRSAEVKRTLLTGLYPLWDISQDAVDASTILIAKAPEKSSQWRYLTESQSDVKHALAARAFDARP